MKSEERKLLFEDLKTIAHHRDQLSRKCQQIEWMLTGLDQPLLPEGWTDEDAWELARSLAKLMGQVALIEHTTFDEQHP